MTQTEPAVARAMALHPLDNVATLVTPAEAGWPVRIEGPGGAAPGPAEGPRAREAIPFGHKLALRDLRAGEAVIKYGQVIGEAGADIPAGAHVHVHNVRSRRGGKL